MGAYSQRQRRGGGPGLGTTTVQILAVAIQDVDHLIVTFSGPWLLHPTSPDGNFDLDGDQPTLATRPSATTARLTFVGECVPGAVWNLFGQPNWSSTPIAWPATGTL